MLFNTLQFIVFFIVVTICYFKLSHSYRWMLLLLASCYFYMAFIPKYILILGFTIVIDYVAAIFIEKSHGNRRTIFLTASLIANIGILAVFKYYNFINVNLTPILNGIDLHNPLPALSILLPIGLSFHTFQAMSYTIEVYRGNQKAERHFGIYALYVMFYPQLVAGPIERPQNLLPQFHAIHIYDFDKLKSGLMQMGWGFFKKIVIADRLAQFVDYSFGNVASQNGVSLLAATFFYSFQIYCDFSGYSDIAIGAARSMGFTLMDNFKTPYFSKSVAEFWKRWHISLSSWFKDYLYISLGGNRVGIKRWYINLILVFVISGLWHGANWTFIIWGALHGFYYIFSLIKNKLFRPPQFKTILLKAGYNCFQVLATFSVVSFAWIFFRSPSIKTAFAVIGKILTISLNDRLLTQWNKNELVFTGLLVLFMLFKEYFFNTINTKSTFSFIVLFTLLVSGIFVFGVFNQNQFIYFQF